MNTTSWIFVGLLSVTLILYILGFVKGINPLEKTVRVLFVPFIAGLIISILTLYLPDAHHIITISSISFGVAAIHMLFTLGSKNAFLKAMEEIFYALLQTFWIYLILSVYRIYRISQLIFILSGIVYLAGFVVISVFIKKQSFVKYASSIIQYAFSVIFGITTFICMIYEKRLFGIIMFIASLVFMFGTVIIIFQKTRPFAISEKTEKLLITITAICSNALMGAGAILMQIY